MNAGFIIGVTPPEVSFNEELKDVHNHTVVNSRVSVSFNEELKVGGKHTYSTNHSYSIL